MINKNDFSSCIGIKNVYESLILLKAGSLHRLKQKNQEFLRRFNVRALASYFMLWCNTKTQLKHLGVCITCSNLILKIEVFLKSLLFFLDFSQFEIFVKGRMSVISGNNKSFYALS